MPHPWNLSTAKYSDIKDHDYEVALLPVGATEPHGMHLPYGNDVMHAEIIAGQACKAANDAGARCIRLPAMPYGVDANMLEFPFAMHVRQDTINRLILDIAETLVHHGVRKLAILNGHGGNEFKALVRDQSGRNDLFLCLIDWWTVALDVGEELFEHRGDHANEMETSVALALYPELVDMSRAGDGRVRETDFEAINRGWVKISRPWHLLTEDSTVGDPRQASAKKGKKFVDTVVERISRFLVQLSETQITDTFPYENAFGTEER